MCRTRQAFHASKTKYEAMRSCYSTIPFVVVGYDNVEISGGVWHDPGTSFPSPRWTREEEELLRSEYKNSSSAALAKLLGRTRSSVIAKSHNLGLSSHGKARKET